MGADCIQRKIGEDTLSTLTETKQRIVEDIKETRNGWNPVKTEHVFLTTNSLNSRSYNLSMHLNKMYMSRSGKQTFKKFIYSLKMDFDN